MSYPGNASLSQDIRKRIVDTFRQTLSLAESDRRKEAGLGCDFILRLDPSFEPARQLQERLESEEGAIELGDLQQALSAADDAAAPAADESEPPDAAAAPSAPPAAAPTPRTKPSAGAAPPSEPAAAEPEPAAAIDSDSEQRIAELLTEGQTAFERGEYQAAIDAWSRIFLIDIDHAEANRRIELARKLKAEVERSIDEAYHEALSHIDSRQPDAARQSLEKVLELQPDHAAARELLQKLEEGGIEAAGGERPADADAPASADLPPTRQPEGGERPATPEMKPAVAATGRVPVPKPRRPAGKPGVEHRRAFLLIGAAVLVLVLVGSWLLVSNWSRFFPNAAETAETAETAGESLDPIAVAEALHAEGKTRIAIKQLRRLPPHHEQYVAAQSLIAQWETAEEAGRPEAHEPTPEEQSRYDELVRQAEAAFADREYLRSEELLERAAAVRPLDEKAERLRREAAENLEPIRTQVAIFRQGEWERTLRDLWRIREDYPGNRDIERLMVDSYYNLGARALHRGDTGQAIEHFEEALELANGDADIERLWDFARTYQERPQDLRYRIFVKYLPFR